MNRPIEPRYPFEIWTQWDRLAETRMKQIESGIDITYNRILVPAILDIVREQNPSSIIDVGCGIGALTDKLSNYADSVLGIDPSVKSIEVASSKWRNSKFLGCTVEEFVKSQKRQFDVAVANMVLMDAPNLSSFVSACAKTVRPGGVFVFSVTHPCFWPDYYGYSGEEWFNYETEIAIESPFRITKEPDGKILSTHFHRPISQYLNEFVFAELKVCNIKELMPNPEIAALYGAPWKYPRYIVGYCRKLDAVGSSDNS